MLIRNSSPLLTVLDGITIDPPELSGVLRQVGISENLLSMPDARAARVKVVVASFMQPTAE